MSSEASYNSGDSISNAYYPVNTENTGHTHQKGKYNLDSAKLPSSPGSHTDITMEDFEKLGAKEGITLGKVANVIKRGLAGVAKASLYMYSVVLGGVLSLVSAVVSVLMAALGSLVGGTIGGVVGLFKRDVSGGIKSGAKHGFETGMKGGLFAILPLKLLLVFTVESITSGSMAFASEKNPDDLKKRLTSAIFLVDGRLHKLITSQEIKE